MVELFPVIGYAARSSAPEAAARGRLKDKLVDAFNKITTRGGA